MEFLIANIVRSIGAIAITEKKRSVFIELKKLFFFFYNLILMARKLQENRVIYGLKNMSLEYHLPG